MGEVRLARWRSLANAIERLAASFHRIDDVSLVVLAPVIESLRRTVTLRTVRLTIEDQP